MKRLLLLIAFAALLIAAMPSAEAGLCVHRDGHLATTEAQCTDDSFEDPTYFDDAQSEDAQAAIENVCCVWNDADGSHIEPADPDTDFQRYTCELLIAENGGGTAQEGSCADFSGTCSDNQTNCWCGPGWTSTYISADLYCCDNQINDGYCESTGGEDNPPSEPTLCGNGNWNRNQGEACDPTYGPNPVGDCTGSGNSCTQSCSCAIDDIIYDGTDPFCSPGEPCAGSASSCDEGPPAPELSFQPITGTPNLTVKWTFPGLSDCDYQLETLELFSELEGLASMDSRAFGPNQDRSVFSVEGNSTYHFRIVATYTDGSTTEDADSYDTGDPRCFQSGRREFCSEDKSRQIHCTPDNIMVDDGACTSGSCFEMQGGRTTCTDDVPCDECDGAYESTAETRTVAVDTIYGPRNCEELQGTVLISGDIEVRFCYYGMTYGSVAEYESCSEVKSCSDYLLQDSCNDNPCAAVGTCQWYPGGGCNAREAQYQTCEDVPDEACEDLARCALTGDGCVDRQDLSCSQYGDNQTACTGGSSFDLDPHTYQELSRTDDVYGFGKCHWDTQNSVCVRDANDDAQADFVYPPPRGNPSDFESPVTSIPGAVTNKQWGRSISFPVYMNELGDDTATYMELVRGDCPNRPPTDQHRLLRGQDGNLLFQTEAQDGAGDYCLFWYSVDANFNVEQVRTRILDVNPAALRIMSNVTSVSKDLDANTADLNVTINLSRTATCNMSVSNDQHKLYSKNYPHEHVNSRGQAFDLRFVNIPGDATYYADIACSANGDHIEATIEIPVDIDTRITNVFPAKGTYDRSPGNIGVWAERADSCSLIRGAERITLNEVTSTFNGTHTRWISGAAATQGVYLYDTECVFNGETQAGDNSDRIRFAIDTQAPDITVTYADGTPVLPGQTVIAKPAGEILNLTCSDPPLTGGGENWEFGCGTDARIIIEGQSFGTGDPKTHTLKVYPQDRLEVWGRDAGGNEPAAANRRIIRAESSDISGPERPSFEVGP